MRSAILLATLLVAAPAAAQMEGHEHHAMPAEAPSPAAKALQDADARMMQAMMAVPYTGDIDTDFRAHMIPHHQGAIDMARAVLDHSQDPDTRALAEAIIREQEREVAEMRKWLEDNAKPHGAH